MTDDLPLEPISTWAFVLGIPLLLAITEAVVRWPIIGKGFVGAFFATWAAFGFGMLGYAIWVHVPAGNWLTAIFLLGFGVFMLGPIAQIALHTLRKLQQ